MISNNNIEKITLLVPKGTRETIQKFAKELNISVSAYCKMCISIEAELDGIIDEFNTAKQQCANEKDLFKIYDSFKKRISLYKPKFEFIENTKDKIRSIFKMFSEDFKDDFFIETTQDNPNHNSTNISISGDDINRSGVNTILKELNLHKDELLQIKELLINQTRR